MFFHWAPVSLACSLATYNTITKLKTALFGYPITRSGCHQANLKFAQIWVKTFKHFDHPNFPTHWLLQFLRPETYLGTNHLVGLVCKVSGFFCLVLWSKIGCTSEQGARKTSRFLLPNQHIFGDTPPKTNIRLAGKTTTMNEDVSPSKN